MKGTNPYQLPGKNTGGECHGSHPSIERHHMPVKPTFGKEDHLTANPAHVPFTGPLSLPRQHPRCTRCILQVALRRPHIGGNEDSTLLPAETVHVTSPDQLREPVNDQAFYIWESQQARLGSVHNTRESARRSSSENTYYWLLVEINRPR